MTAVEQQLAARAEELARSQPWLLLDLAAALLSAAEQRDTAISERDEAHALLATARETIMEIREWADPLGSHAEQQIARIAAASLSGDEGDGR